MRPSKSSALLTSNASGTIARAEREHTKVDQQLTVTEPTTTKVFLLQIIPTKEVHLCNDFEAVFAKRTTVEKGTYKKVINKSFMQAGNTTDQLERQWPYSIAPECESVGLALPPVNYTK